MTPAGAGAPAPGPGLGFADPMDSFADFGPAAAADLAAAAADLALVLAPDGTIRDLACAEGTLATELGGDWIGRALTAVATPESAPKIEAMLRDAAESRAPRWRQINHPGRAGDVPMQYLAVAIDDARLIALGRDLRPLAETQQRLIAAQQAVDREYARLRQTETRYRLLFEATPEAVLIVDAAGLRVVEANPAAARAFGEAAARLIGRPALDLFAADGGEALQTLLAAARAAGRGGEVAVKLADGTPTIVGAALFRVDGTALFMLRVAVRAAPATVKADTGLLARLPEGLVRTDAQGRVMEANGAFLDMIQVAGPDQALGEPLDRWLGRPGVDMSVLLANLRQHGAVRFYATSLSGEFGDAIEVEVSGALLPEADPPGAGFLVHDVGRRLAPPRRQSALPRSREELKDLVGRVPMKDLVRETVDVLEQLCIEAALELTGDNRASAAEILGLSRQSLYVKLRRYGMSDSEPEASAD